MLFDVFCLFACFGFLILWNNRCLIDGLNCFFALWGDKKYVKYCGFFCLFFPFCTKCTFYAWHTTFFSLDNHLFVLKSLWKCYVLNSMSGKDFTDCSWPVNTCEYQQYFLRNMPYFVKLFLDWSTVQWVGIIKGWKHTTIFLFFKYSIYVSVGWFLMLPLNIDITARAVLCNAAKKNKITLAFLSSSAKSDLKHRSTMKVSHRAV